MNTLDLHELVYISLATREMSVEELDELLNQSRLNNEKRDITGILIYHDKKFIQLLEGNKEDILRLHQAISNDYRNTQNRVIYTGQINSRSFSGWSMAFHRPSEEYLQDNPGFTSMLEEGDLSNNVSSQKSIARSVFLSLRNSFLTNAEKI